MSHNRQAVEDLVQALRAEANRSGGSSALGGLDIAQFAPEQLYAIAEQVLANQRAAPPAGSFAPPPSVPPAGPTTEVPTPSLAHSHSQASSSGSGQLFPHDQAASAHHNSPPFLSGPSSTRGQAPQLRPAEPPSSQLMAPRITPYQSQRVQQAAPSLGPPSHFNLPVAPPSLSLVASAPLGFPPACPLAGPSTSQPFVGFEATRAPQTRPRVNMGRQQSLARTGGGRQRGNARASRASSQVVPSAPEGTQKRVASTCVTAAGQLRLRIHVYPPAHVSSVIYFPFRSILSSVAA